MAKPPPVAVEGSLGWAPPPIQVARGAAPSMDLSGCSVPPQNVTMVTLSRSTEETTKASSIISHPTTSALQATWDPSFELKIIHIFLLLPAGRSQRSCLFPNIPHVCCGETRAWPVQACPLCLLQGSETSWGAGSEPSPWAVKERWPSLPVGLSYASLNLSRSQPPGTL